MAIRIEIGPEQRCSAVVDGSMTIYEAAADKPVLLDALARAAETEIDLSSVREMDTAGLQLLVLARRESLNAGKVVRLARPSAAALDVLERYGLTAYFGAFAGGDAAARCERAGRRTKARAKTGRRAP